MADRGRKLRAPLCLVRCYRSADVVAKNTGCRKLRAPLCLVRCYRSAEVLAKNTGCFMFRVPEAPDFVAGLCVTQKFVATVMCVLAAFERDTYCSHGLKLFVKNPSMVRSSRGPDGRTLLHLGQEAGFVVSRGMYRAAVCEAV